MSSEERFTCYTLSDSERIDKATASRIASWRNSLFCASNTRPLYFLALGDRILVYERDGPQNLGQDCWTVSKELQNPGTEANTPASSPGQRRPTVRPYGAQPGPFDGPDINCLKISMLGKEEVLISADGLGRVIIRYVDRLDGIPILLDAKVSAWGLAIHGRMLAVSKNSHEVDVYNLGDHDDRSNVETKKQDTSNETKREKVILRGAASNIPNIAFSSDGNYLAAVDVRGTVRIWNMRNLGNRTSVYSDIHLTNLDHRNWSCLWLEECQFREVDRCSYSEKSRSEPEICFNPVRTLCPQLAWWAAAGANIRRDLDPSGNRSLTQYELMLCVRYASRGLLPDPVFVAHWRYETLELFQSYVEYTSDDLLLVTTIDMVFLMHATDFKMMHALCMYPFGSRYVSNNAFERINMVRYVENLGCVLIASQKGAACLLELVKSTSCEQDSKKELYSYSFRCNAFLDGVLVEEEQELLGLDVVNLGPRRVRIVLIFRSGRVISRNVERNLESSQCISEPCELML